MKPRLHRISHQGVTHYATVLYRGTRFQTLCSQVLLREDIYGGRKYVTCLVCMSTPIDKTRYREAKRGREVLPPLSQEDRARGAGLDYWEQVRDVLRNAPIKPC